MTLDSAIYKTAPRYSTAEGTKSAAQFFNNAFLPKDKKYLLRVKNYQMNRSVFSA